MSTKLLKYTCLATVLSLSSVYAGSPQKNITMVGVTNIKISSESQKFSNKDNLENGATKSFQVLKVKISPQMQNYISKHAVFDSESNTKGLRKITTEFSTKSVKLPSKVNLSMNHVPVFDQGQHDTSSTFAVTAALDAGYGHGDYISQLCNLQLGQYLQSKDSYYESGWNGSLNQSVFEQIQKYGIISKDYQTSSGCGGLKEYPVSSSRIGYAMSDVQFSNYHEEIMKILSFKKIYDLSDDSIENVDPIQWVTDAKTQLAQGHRLTVQFLIDTKYGDSGAHGSSKYWHDTWVITEEVLDEMFEGNVGAQSAVIVGYDDDAIATSGIFNQAKGLFILRNSWGDSAGDNGNYYMSYNYLMALALQGHVIISPIDLPVTQ